MLELVLLRLLICVKQKDFADKVSKQSMRGNNSSINRFSYIDNYPQQVPRDLTTR